ncbi:hypothetical protein Agub_g11751 [Astrephomene gubernaculifera]|uniref:EGF-like domain-containing protein n=1 Tax=Astrephomene gubernaculifera TaxID=47775 RepID=A0AAD3DXD9_9CHLO|nr:hypothetical protein Agub_g11751 [Astrephomene gubernaculifera]
MLRLTVVVLGLLGYFGLQIAASETLSPISRFREIKLPCAKGCELNGNCNAEFGRCECRFGFTGDDCSIPLIPACLTTLHNASYAVPQYGYSFPKNCYCYRQLARIACAGEYWKDPFLCNQHAFWGWDLVRCYEYTDVPEQQQLSDPPEPGGSRGVVWKKGVRKEGVAGPEFYALEPLQEPVPERWGQGMKLLPLDKCSERCNERGTCVDLHGGTSCRCAPFYTGPTCADSAFQHCPLNCSGRGVCHGGYCHCRPGYWGAGCSRSRAYSSEDWLPHPTQLRIYVYELPESVAYMRPNNDEWPLHHAIYLAEIELYQRLLGDWEVRTENPWEANLFFVPTHTYYYIGNIGFPGKHFTSVFHWLRQSHPWWNLTAGRNHVAATSNDRGCCDLYRLGQEVQHPIKLVHFGQAPRHGVPLSREGPGGVQWSERPEDLASRLNSNLEDPAMVGAMAEFAHLAGRPRFKGFPPYQLPALQQEREQCYRPEHDVNFPPYIPTEPNDGAWPDLLPQAYTYGPDGRAAFRRDNPRDLLFSFNGYSKTDMAYSAGVRQGLLALFGNTSRPDISINKGGGTKTVLRSRFCFAPMGFGWGIRLSQAVIGGCVPVLVHDHVWPILWDVLPYERFSLRVSRHNLHLLLELLESVTPQQLERLQDGLAEVHKAFVWQRELGGLAYNYTMTSLHRRLLNMWTAFF